MRQNPPGNYGNKRLTQDDKDKIVEMRLEGATIRATATAIGCSTNTVHKTFTKWLEARTAERNKNLDKMLEESIARMERNAIAARQGFTRANSTDHQDTIRWLEAERKAVTELLRIHTTLIQAKNANNTTESAQRVAETLEAFLNGATPTFKTVEGEADETVPTDR